MVSTRREDLNPVKEQLATDREDVDTLADALQGADVFLGVSAPGILTPEMVRTMAHDPLVLALANPTPEITYEEAMASRPDIIFATGRSDYPNQVNNVLAFPYLFRGALDVYASTINDEMKLAVTHALARLAKEPVPQEVLKTYGLKSLSFGREYLIPKPSDPRLLAVVATAVARAAIESGVARREIEDWDAYAASLTRRVKTQSKPESLPIRTGIKKAPRDLFGALFCLKWHLIPTLTNRLQPEEGGKTAIGKEPG